jgi:hypothetical protein
MMKTQTQASMLFVALLGFTLHAGADCGAQTSAADEQPHKEAAKSYVATSTSAQRDADMPASRWSAEPASRDPEYTPYEDGGYNP